MFLTIIAEEPLNAMNHVLPHYLFGSHWFTNQHLMSLVVLVLGTLILLYVARKCRVPAASASIEDYVTKGPTAQLFETICVFLRDSMTRPLLGDATDRYIYYIWSTFFFILFCNVIGLIPFGAALGLMGLSPHLSGTATANVNFTAGLAVVAFIMIHVVGIRERGLAYFKHFCPVPLKLDFLLPLMLVIAVAMVVLELVGAVVKPFALCVRLFANMVAGHLVLASLIVLGVTTASWLGKGGSIVGAAIFSFMELFVAFLQAYIFAFLTVIFISLGAVSHDGHDHGEDHGHNHDHGQGAQAPAHA